MDRIFLLLATYTILVTPSYAQMGEKRDYIWPLGYNINGENFEPERLLLDFNSGELETRLTTYDTRFRVTHASICDKEGNLLFYTNGCHVANQLHEIMENGDTLNPGPAYGKHCPDFGYPASQGALILPNPRNEMEYYLFHQSINREVVDGDADVYVEGLYMTTIDMDGDGGLGVVKEKNIRILDERLFSGVTACKHANGRDWWLLTTKKLSNQVYTFLISNTGVSIPSVQSIGFIHTRRGEGSGQYVFSPDGKYFVKYDKSEGLQLFNFDRVTGLLSNHRELFVADTLETGGVAFSPNSRFLYLTHTLKAYQYDIEAKDINASKVVVAEYDGFTSPFPTIFYQPQLAPDCKIYVNTQSSAQIMHVIHNPNEKGLACNFEQHGIALPTDNSFTNVNFPHYRLGTEYPVCDTSRITSTSLSLPLPRIQVAPNPASDYFTISWLGNWSPINQSLRLELYG